MLAERDGWGREKDWGWRRVGSEIGWESEMGWAGEMGWAKRRVGAGRWVASEMVGEGLVGMDKC